MSQCCHRVATKYTIGQQTWCSPPWSCCWPSTTKSEVPDCGTGCCRKTRKRLWRRSCWPRTNCIREGRSTPALLTSGLGKHFPVPFFFFLTWSPLPYNCFAGSLRPTKGWSIPVWLRCQQTAPGSSSYKGRWTAYMLGGAGTPFWHMLISDVYIVAMGSIQRRASRTERHEPATCIRRNFQV